MKQDERYQAYKRLWPKRIPHWEPLSCPDGMTYCTGIDFYEHPRLCALKMNEMYPMLYAGVPDKDEPIPRPDLDGKSNSVSIDEHGRRSVRWGASTSSHWDWGIKFKDVEEVLAFSPLELGDFTDLPLNEARDYRDEEKLFQVYSTHFPAEWGGKLPEGEWEYVGFYNTMIMWPILTFGWELFLEAALDPRFERIMDEFAEINRRVFRTFTRLPVTHVLCHDDIVGSRGPYMSPTWMRKFIFPRYEEFWGILREAGKEVIMITDGCADVFVDDIFACGAVGIFTEPYTDFKAIARKHENCFLVGEGDNRVLCRNNPEEIKAMVHSMIETSKMTGGYMMGIGNHIPWNTSPEGLKLYLDLCHELAHR